MRDDTPVEPGFKGTDNLEARADRGRLADRLSTLVQAPWLRWLLVAGLVVLYTGWIGYVIHYNKTIDFYVYYTGGLIARQGLDVFELTNREYADLGGFPGYSDDQICYADRYPPFFRAGMVPFTLLAPRLAAVVWVSASALAMMISAWLLSRTFHTSHSEVAMLVLAGSSVPALATLHAGQVNIFVLLSLALALFAYKRDRPVWAGLGLGASVLLKLTPIALVVYMFWRRQYKLALTALLVVVVAILNLSFALRGATASVGAHAMTPPSIVRISVPKSSMCNAFRIDGLSPLG